MYEWYFNGAKIPNTDQYFYVPSEPGLYQVRVYNEDGCSTISEEVDVIIGIEDVLDGVSLQMHPNPSSGLVVLEVNATVQDAIHLAVYDASGRLLLSKNSLDIRPGQQSIELDVSGLSSGFYLLKLHNHKGQVSRQLIIQK
jgi:hypothetical protein